MRQARVAHDRSRSAICFSATRAAAAALALAVLVGGCERESEKSDADVQQKVAQADLAMAYHPSASADAVAQANKAVEASKLAANEAGASDVGKAQAQTELAMAELNLARITLGQVDAERSALGNTLTRMDTLSTLINGIGQGVADDLKFQPTVAQQTVSDQITAVQGAADKPVWQPHGTAPIPSLAAINAKITSLSNDIDNLKAQRKQLADEQAAAASKAADLTDQGDKAKGQAAVDLYTQAADSRKTANDKGAQIELIDGQLLPMQQQLTLAQKEATDLNAVVAAMQKTNSDMSGAWDKTQAAIDAQKARARDLVDGSGGAGSRQPGESTDTVNGLADQWVKQAKDLKGLRTSAVDHLGKAKTALTSAVRLAEAIQKTYRDQKQSMPDAIQANSKNGAWTNMIDLYNPGRLNLSLANVEGSLADLYQGAASDAADQAKTVDQLTKALGTAQLPVPDALTSMNFGKEQKDNAALAELAFKAAEVALGNASMMGSTELTRADAVAAQAAKVLEMYDHGQFELAQGDQATGETLIADAKKQLAAYQQSNGEMPEVLPAALMPQQPGTAPGGESAPATSPATQPSAG
jgi:hypothetical protein